MKHWVKLIGVAICAIFTLGLAVFVGIQSLVDTAVRNDAIEKAKAWEAHFISTIPDMSSLMIGQNVSDLQRQVIANASQFGDVFRFKIFGADGNLHLVSDELENTGQHPPYKHADKIREVVESGKGFSVLFDGRAKQNRPTLYAETYVPITSASGNHIAAAEVYIDQTNVAQSFVSAFRSMAIIVTSLFTIAFGLPFAAYLMKHHQEGQARRKVEHMARYDDLTETLNRRSLNELSNVRASETGDRWNRAATLFIDVDNFKAINDTYGHAAGDKYLLHIASTLKRYSRDEDLIARMGGDEFSMVSLGHSKASAEQLAEAILNSTRRPFAYEGQTIIGQVSIGVHFEEECNDALEQRLHCADIALFQSKLDGRNRYTLYSPELEERIIRSRQIEEAVAQGLENGLFHLEYQPLIDSKKQRCSGFEALLRLTLTDGTRVGPDEFIPVAEATGAIVPIGHWVINEAIRALSGWDESLSISINLSPNQFEDPRLVDVVKNAIAGFDVDPARVEFEITESTLLRHPANVAKRISELKQIGVTIAMDDFGAGYSSLSYLWEFEFDKLKLDKSFLTKLDIDADRLQDLLSSIITMGHQLDLVVTAEGVETVQQVAILQGLDCDYFQGFYFGRPMTESALPSYLLNNVLAGTMQEDLQEPGLVTAKLA